VYAPVKGFIYLTGVTIADEYSFGVEWISWDLEVNFWHYKTEFFSLLLKIFQSERMFLALAFCLY